MFTENQLHFIMPNAGARAATFYPALLHYMEAFAISTPSRMQCFLATIAHESGQLKYTKELWGPTAAQTGYEGRRDLGNTHTGDGKLFMGRGLIQVTGRSNYTQLAAALGIDCVNHPEILADPENAVRSACWWWANHGCNTPADANDFRRVTLIVNGGYNGWDDRLSFYERAKKVLSVTDFGNVEAGSASV